MSTPVKPKNPPRPRRAACEYGSPTTTGTGDKAVCDRCHKAEVTNQFKRHRAGIRFTSDRGLGSYVMAQKMEKWLTDRGMPTRHRLSFGKAA